MADYYKASVNEVRESLESKMAWRTSSIILTLRKIIEASYPAKPKITADCFGLMRAANRWDAAEKPKAEEQKKSLQKESS